MEKIMNHKVILNSNSNKLKRTRKEVVDFIVILTFLFLSGDFFMTAYTTNNDDIAVQPIREDTIILPIKQGYYLVNINGEKAYLQDDNIMFIQENEEEGEVTLFHHQKGILDQYNYSGNVTQANFEKNTLKLLIKNSIDR